MLYTILLIAVVTFIGTFLLLYRRRPGAADAAVSTTATASDDDPPEQPGAPLALPVESVPLVALQRRALARVLQAPTLERAGDDVPDGVHAQVLVRCRAMLERLDVQPRHLPRRPQLLPQLTRAVNDPHASFRAIAAIIAQDPALAANLLRIANSALYRPSGQPVQDIERAVVLVGSDGVRRIVMAALMQPVLDLQGGVLDRLAGQAWDEALHVAAAAAEHAQRHGQNGDALSAQLLGLLHGLGAVVVLRVLRDAYALHPALAPAPAPVVIAALLEDEVATAARAIARSWQLPAALGDTLDSQRRVHDAVPPATTLARALRYGRLAATLATLARAEAQDASEALARLALLEPDTEANARLWQRLVAPVE
jgi:HD-like signal output (HDOD) protein